MHAAGLPAACPPICGLFPFKLSAAHNLAAGLTVLTFSNAHTHHRNVPAYPYMDYRVSPFFSLFDAFWLCCCCACRCSLQLLLLLLPLCFRCRRRRRSFLGSPNHPAAAGMLCCFHHENPVLIARLQPALPSPPLAIGP